MSDAKGENEQQEKKKERRMKENIDMQMHSGEQTEAFMWERHSLFFLFRLRKYEFLMGGKYIM